MTTDFGDSEPDDVVTEGDENIDVSQVDKVASQVDSINEIEDDNERREAAEKWAEELEGDA